MAVTKISSCQVNTTGRRGIKQLDISFDSILILFSYERSRGEVVNNNKGEGAYLTFCP